MKPKRLYKSTTNKQISGVCGGIAEYFQIDPSLVRIIFFVLTVSGSIGFWLYLTLALILPYDYEVYPSKFDGGDNEFFRHFTGRHQTNTQQGVHRKDVTPDNDASGDRRWDDF